MAAFGPAEMQGSSCGGGGGGGDHGCGEVVVEGEECSQGCGGMEKCD